MYLIDKNKIKEESERERRERASIWKNRIIYSLPVRVGYWRNAQALHEQNQEIYSYKKEHCQLLTQNTRKMFRNLLKPISTALETLSIKYGKVYQIKTDDVNGTVLPVLFLSGLVSEREIDLSCHFRHGCKLTASPDGTRCVRNTFQFVGCENAEQIGVVNYGEDVYIKIIESEDLPLYVQSENASMDSFGYEQSVRLTQSPDIYCRFQIIHWQPNLRKRSAGTFVHYNRPVLIRHTASGLNLAAERGRWLLTFFGDECDVTCHTYRDTHKMETAENMWRIVGTEK